MVLKPERQNSLDGFLQHRLLGPAPSFDSEGLEWGLRSHISHKFPDDAGPHFEMHCSRWTPGSWGQVYLTLAGGIPEELPDATWKEVTEGFLEEEVPELSLKLGFSNFKKKGRKKSFGLYSVIG